MNAVTQSSGANTAPLWDLIDESREEATFLWRRWEAELDSLTRNLDEIYLWTEDRLQGALDGVRAAGDTQLLSALAPCLQSTEPTQLTLAAHLLANATAPSARELLTTTLQHASGSVLDALVRGIETATLDRSFAVTASMLGKQSPAHCAALFRIKAFQRATPGQELADAYRCNDPLIQAQAMRAAAYLPADYCLQWVETGLHSEANMVRLAAIETGIRQRIPNTWNAAVQFVREAPHESAPLLKPLAIFGAEAEHQTLWSILEQVEFMRPAAIAALGLLGTPEVVQQCLTLMSDAKLARFAGEAYCLITGADLERDKLAAPEADSEPVSFEADDLDANLVPAMHESWPLPDVAAVQAHWNSIQQNYASGVRHVRGQVCTLHTLLEAVESGPMLRRNDHVLELVVRTKGQFDVETRAFHAVQRRMLAASRHHVTG